EEIVFRCLLYKLFNRIDTWEELVKKVGLPTWRHFRFESFARALDSMVSRGARVYSGAYIMPSPRLGSARKHRNHLRLLERMMLDGVPTKVERARSLSEVYGLLRTYSSLGAFLACQSTIALTYIQLLT